MLTITECFYLDYICVTNSDMWFHLYHGALNKLREYVKK